MKTICKIDVSNQGANNIILVLSEGLPMKTASAFEWDLNNVLESSLFYASKIALHLHLSRKKKSLICSVLVMDTIGCESEKKKLQ